MTSTKTSGDIDDPEHALLIAAVTIGAFFEDYKTAGDIKDAMQRSFERSGFELRKVKSDDK